jgi:hypothetical protein
VQRAADLLDARRKPRAGHGGRSVVVHAALPWLGPIRAGQVPFFTGLARRLAAEGMAMRTAALGGAASQVLAERNHLHVVVGGPAPRSMNALHAGPAHVPGFWYLDGAGTKENSSIRCKRFDPGQVDGAEAEYFFNGVSGFMLRENVSNLPQAAREPQEEAAAAIFLQRRADEEASGRRLSTEEMIRTTAEAAAGRPVFVKPHPDSAPRLIRRIEALCEGVEILRLSRASIHDLAQAAEVVVTHASSAGFEALMQKKAVITCAAADYRHATLSPRDAADLHLAVREGAREMADFPFEKYFHWFLGRQCLEPRDAAFEERAWARIRESALARA